ncbi:MAG: hypothetical protein SGARI_004500 [Bacillariaceae sp.]
MKRKAMDHPLQQPQPRASAPPMNSKPRFLVVNGIRYIRPYLYDQTYSVRMQHADQKLTIAEVLAHAFGRESNQWKDSVKYFHNEIAHGRVQWKRNKLKRDDDEPKFQTVLNADEPTRRNDILKIQRHIHERCMVGADLVTIPCYSSNHNTTAHNNHDSHDAYIAVLKPAGIPVVGSDGACHGSVTGILQGDDDDYRLGHRIDLPVSGILLLGKGPSRAKKIVQALSPTAKQASDGFAKAYLARVKGGKDAFGGKGANDRMEIKCKLQWDNRQKKAIAVEDESVDNRSEEAKKHKSKKTCKETVTYVQQLQYDPASDTSLVRVELLTGARQQIRAVLASLGTPIIGDTTYDGGEFPSNEGNEDLKLFHDDDNQSLLTMLQEEHKEWCDKCRWQIQEVKKGGTKRGTEQLGHQICLLSYHYRIPALGIDAKVPDELIPEWAKMR